MASDIDITEEPMKRDPVSAVIVDVIDQKDKIDAFVAVIVGKGVGASKHVYCLTRDQSVHLPDNHNGSLNVSTVSGESRVSTFYKAKQDFDNRNISNILICCTSPMKQYWSILCGLLLTPVHTFEIETIPSEETCQFDGLSLEKEVKTMLKTLPSNGEITLLTTSGIPTNLFNHGYTTRTGGITTIPGMKSLNVLYTIKKRDSPLAVEENLRRLAEVAGFEMDSFILTRTEHGCKVWNASQPRPEKFDAVVTDQPGLTLAAAGADCTPLLFADPVKRVCGAAHAGYRGTVKQVVVKTLTTLVETYGCRPKDVQVTLGPTLCANCFSIDATDPSVEEFRAIDPSTIEYRKKGGTTKVHTDLVKSNRILLEKAGVLPRNIDCTHAVCTACDPQRFFSYERDGLPFANQIGFISIKPQPACI